MLYVDIPTPADISALAAHRGDMCVSIYLRTTPVTQEAQADRRSALYSSSVSKPPHGTANICNGLRGQRGISLLGRNGNCQRVPQSCKRLVFDDE